VSFCFIDYGTGCFRGLRNLERTKVTFKWRERMQAAVTETLFLDKRMY